MSQLNPKVDKYFEIGCGRCSLSLTPDCKSKRWNKEIAKLRELILETGLKEELKWGVPCYTYQKKNVVLIGGFKEYCSVSFFKGALLKDPKGILEKPGENTQAARLIRFTNLSQVKKLATSLKRYIMEAIALEHAGKKAVFKKQPEAMPDELVSQLEEQPELRKAFESLTPGRQRGYILYFSAPKQPKTRIARIEKCTPMILQGKGIHDDYRSSRK